MSVSALHRVNLNFQFKVELRFNKDSENRVTDDTPRFCLKATKLLHVENVGFTRASRNKGYIKHGNRFWRYKAPDNVTDEKVEEVWETIKTSYPYGYMEGDTPSYLKYDLDVKQNQSFQSHYARYWKKNESTKIVPTLRADGTYVEGHSYPYMEFVVNEIVTLKIPKGKIPAKADITSTWAEYPTDGTYYQFPDAYSCQEEDINVYVSDDSGELAFYVNGFEKYPITVHSSGGSYNFHLVSGMDYLGNILWPTGDSWGNWSGYKFSLSTGYDGSWNDFDEYTTNVTRFVSPKTYPAWNFKIAQKNTSHPYYGGTPHSLESGHHLGYEIDGIDDQAPVLSLVRGSTYTFNQSVFPNNATDSHQTGYRLHISAHSGTTGLAPDIWTSGVTYTYSERTEAHWNWAADRFVGGSTIFKVPFNAPDTLYYVSEGPENTYMGNRMVISDPVPASGDKPFETVRVTFNQQEDKLMTYYSPSGKSMGSYLFLKKECDGQVVDF